MHQHFSTHFLLLRLDGDSVACMPYGRLGNLNFTFWPVLYAPVSLVLAMMMFGGHLRADPAAITLADGVAPHINSWATLRLTLPRLGGGDITVDIRDLRGGPTIRRTLKVFRRHILMPLPYVIGDGGNWPVEVTMQHARKVLRVLNVDINPPRTGAIQNEVVAVCRNTRSRVGSFSAELEKVLTPILFSRRGLAASPVMNFASCRWMLLDRATAQLLPRRRVMALLTLGVRLACISAKPPGIPPVSAWHRIEGKFPDGDSLWTTPPLHGLLRGPPVVVPHLARLHIPPLQTPDSWGLAAWGIGPVTIIMLILLHGAIKRRRGFILAGAIGAAVLSAAAVFWLTATTPVQTTEFQWQTYFVPTGFHLRSTVTLVRSAQVRAGCATTGHDITLPLAWSNRSWFAFHGILDLRKNAATLSYPISRRVHILAYQMRMMPGPSRNENGSGEDTLPGAARKTGFSLNSTVRFADGRIFMPPASDHGRDFYNWLNQKNPMVQSTLRLWLLMQYRPHRSYDLTTDHDHVGIVVLPNMLR